MATHLISREKTCFNQREKDFSAILMLFSVPVSVQISFRFQFRSLFDSDSKFCILVSVPVDH